MSLVLYLVTASLFLIASYFLGREHGNKNGYEKGKEMWKHPSEPTDRFGEAEPLVNAVKNMGYDGIVSVQTRELDRGGACWIVEHHESEYNE